MTGTSGDRPFRTLLVCTANQCRSPMAEHLLRRELSERGLHWDIASAGTKAVEGADMAPLARRELERRSIDVGAWSARSLERGDVEQADLILTATHQHRAAVVTLQPTALSITFPLLQFARYAAVAAPLAGTDPPHVGRDLLRAVLAARSHVQPGRAGANDLADPIGRRRRAYRACADTIAAALSDILSPYAEARRA